jgi:CubicO group peptidase (beta-lactamase class C family)
MPRFLVRIAALSSFAVLLASVGRSEPLPRATPESQGVPSSAVLAFLDAAEKVDQMNSFMLLRHGRVVAEGWWVPYRSTDPHMMYSLSKSFTSTAVGIAIAEGKLALDDPVLKFFPAEAPAQPSDNLRAMRVRDLLNMNTGHHAEDIASIQLYGGDSVVKAFLSAPVAHKPGTHFMYNTPGTYMCSAIVQRATGQKVVDYLGPRLFEPLGIADSNWDESAEGVSMGGTGLHVTTEDVARFGQLYLQRGRWGDGAAAKQLVPAEWVDLATSRQTSNGSAPDSDWEQGYGYQFWRCRHGFYRGDGAFGQYCIVMPQHDAVLAITSGVADMQAVMNAAWDNLLAAMQAKPLAEDPPSQTKLAERCRALTAPPVSGNASSPQAAKASGVKYVLESNALRWESISLDFDAEGATLHVDSAGRETTIPVGHGSWRRGGEMHRDGALRSSVRWDKVAATGAWIADDAYQVKAVMYETPYYMTATFRFAGDQITVEARDNVSFGDPTFPSFSGRQDR